jgi:thymidylate synthase
MFEQDYLNLLKNVKENGYSKVTRNGVVKSLFGATLRHHMKNGFPLLTTKKMHWKSIVLELMWFLKGDTNIKTLLDDNVNIWTGDAYTNYCNYTSANSSKWNKWMKNNGDGSLSMYTKDEFVDMIKTNEEFAEYWGDLGPIYGKQWRDWRFRRNAEKVSIDQVYNVISELKNNPDSRRLLVSAWNVGDLDECVLPPCHYAFQFWTRRLTIVEQFDYLPLDVRIAYANATYEAKRVLCMTYGCPERELSIMFNMRSTDLLLGLPFNIASYALLMCLIAKGVNMVPGEVIYNGADAHVYEGHFNAVDEQIMREPYQFPRLSISDRTIDDISEYTLSDLTLIDYNSHPSIKAPLFT